MSNKYILAIDQGTSSTKSLIFDEKGQAIAKGTENLHTHYLDHGFVEQEPEVIYQNVLTSVAKCLQEFAAKGFDASAIAGIGISNQRETFVVWDKTGKPLHNAVVWQCKRSVQICEELKQQGLSEQVNQKTGLVIDPYFSATKLIWLNRNNEAVKSAIQQSEAYFGTIDTWLLYKFSNGKAYATDYTNVSRTLLFNLHSLQWDQELIDAFGLTGIQLPEVKSSSASFGETTLDGLFAQPVPVTAMIGDSHAAAFGEGCFEAGTAKATLGTGCSILMNIGDKPVQSNNGMVTTICWSIDGRIDYAFEGVIVSCGATIEWLKNELNLFTDSKQTEAMATAVADNGGVYLIPAFSGLGSPHWQAERRASISGMSFGTTKNHIVRAALESIPYQIKDVVSAMQSDATFALKSVNINGGISGNRFVMQMIADLLQINITRSAVADASALGAAFLARLGAKLYKNLEELKACLAVDTVYQPNAESKFENFYRQWQLRIQDYSNLPS
ncbi:glycerol kinase GlpK [Lacibacter luteus]|uniref:ATP:glycerol 3-phosphotransferase n=1 Tax=Lacibacter luteus TaxID=2508719 RepID=A0A4Q1CEJ7_9BACT|nr:glycerol kinase GlpK [Lacibacter luteus]RXK57977.1 glycerol kinase GlpK [Lacibacter luteus]